MKTAVIYVRVRDRLNPQAKIKAQKAFCQQYANEKGMDVVDTYIDNEEFGTPNNRVALDKMIDDSLTATWDTIIIYDSSRICRNIKQFMKIEKTLEERGKSLLIVASPDRHLYKDLIQELLQRRRK